MEYDDELFDKSILFILNGVNYANILIGMLDKRGYLRGHNIVQVNGNTLTTSLFSMKNGQYVGRELTKTWTYPK